MSDDPSETYVLLSRWHAGDQEALGSLVARDLPWIRAHVERQLGDGLRAHTDAEDVVQEAMLAALRDGPRFLVSDITHFRALVARIVKNILRMQHRFLHQERRNVRRQRQLPLGESVLQLDASGTRPSQAAMRNETQSWMQLCIDLLDEPEREVILLRQWDELSFVDIGKQLGIDQGAARMRFERALVRLGALMKHLQGGGLAAVLAERGVH